MKRLLDCTDFFMWSSTLPKDSEIQPVSSHTCAVWHSILLTHICLHMCANNTHDPSDDPFDRGKDFPQNGLIQRQIDAQREKKKSPKRGGSCGAFLRLVLIDRKHKLHKLSQGELHLSDGLTRLCHWWEDLCWFILSAPLHGYQSWHQLSKTEMQECYFSMTAFRLWKMAHCKFWGNGLESSLLWKPVWFSVCYR